MARRWYELTDGERAILSPLLPNKSRGVPRVDDRRVLNGILHGLALGGDAGALWAADDLLQSLRASEELACVARLWKQSQ